MERNTNSQSSEDEVQILSSTYVKKDDESVENLAKPSTSKSNCPVKKNDKLIKRGMKSQLRDKINTKRKRLDDEDEDEFYGSPYVVLAKDNEQPITCYMVPKKTNTNINQFIATSSQNLIASPNRIVPKLVLNPPAPVNQNQTTNPPQAGSKNNQNQLNSTVVVHADSSPQVLKVGQNLQPQAGSKNNQNQLNSTVVVHADSSPQVLKVGQNLQPLAGSKTNQNQLNSTVVVHADSPPQVLKVGQNLQLKVAPSGNQSSSSPSVATLKVGQNLQVKVATSGNQSSPSPSTNVCPPVAPDSPEIESDIINQVSEPLPPTKPKPNQIQITMIDPKAPPGSSKIITKTLTKVTPPFKPAGPSREPTFPVRQVLPKITKESTNSTLLLQTQKYLQDKIKSLKEELDVTKWQLNEQRKNTMVLKTLEDKLIIKKRQIKTMCTQRKRLTKRLENCREELEKTRKALELVESQAVLWNNSNMSDLGKLIFSLHTVKNRRSSDSKSAANKAPPEVKGFVISLYMTSPKAYQLVRDCFNGLPHPKTVAKWLHGERVEGGDVTRPSPPEVNEAALEETFSRVIESEPQEEEEQEMEQIETDQFLTEHEIINEDEESPAVYYVLDETGNVAGQLTGSDGQLIFSADGFDFNSVPHHEVVIGE